MGKSLYIAEKPSVAREFAKAIGENFQNHDGYMESAGSVVTWCVGHLVTMSYPEVYDPALKNWRLETLPFIPEVYKYELIPDVKKQFTVVSGQLNRADVDRIYVCTDSAREGEYIYRLVDQMANVPDTKDKRRVWLNSQTEEEVLRGIKEAKPLSEYNNLADSAYLRAKEDYLMGINFSRVLTLKYGFELQNFLKAEKRGAISVGRVMTCVLGMIVRREREIRAFDKTPFFRVVAGLLADENGFDGEFKAVEGSKYFESPVMYKENGFKKKETAEQMVAEVTAASRGEAGLPELTYETLCEGKDPNVPTGYKTAPEGVTGEIAAVEKKNEKKNAPLLFNLAELQAECSKLFKISPDQTLQVVQELYEKKMVTYPRTDARVLSSAVAKEIDKNIRGLAKIGQIHEFVEDIMTRGSYKGLEKTKYVDDKQISDHYAIIPTGQGLQALTSLSPLQGKIFELICRRFLSIFYPPAVYRKISLTVQIGAEKFFANFKVLKEEGWMVVAGKTDSKPQNADDAEQELGMDAIEKMEALAKGQKLSVSSFTIRMGETSPPKRYNSGSMILAMENAGKLIEDEELRATIKKSGIGTSATRAEILKKLVNIKYINLNSKTQIYTPTLQGELIYEVVSASIKSLLNPELTASWEKGLNYVADGTIGSAEYLDKMNSFVTKHTDNVKQLNNKYQLQKAFADVGKFYKN